jgi:hypothetical protein
VDGKTTETGPSDRAGSTLDAARKRRLNYGKLPRPGCGNVPYANRRDELGGLSLGEKVAIVTASATWERVMVPILDALEAERPKKGPRPAYTSHELERALLFQRMSGKHTYAESRTLLAGDRGGRCRRALDFERPRSRVGRNLRLVESLDGVPSEKTVWRHLRRFGLDRHAAAYKHLFEELVADHIQAFPEEMAQELRLMDFDGSAIPCHRSSFERKNNETGEVKPPTLTGGGFRPRTEDNPGKDGHGFAFHGGITSTGLPILARLTAINTAEAATMAEMLREDWRRRVAPLVALTDDAFGVMAFDAAYSGPQVRTEVHAAGYVPNCHPVSHAVRDRSEENARRHDRMRYAIEGKPGWFSNGHREVFCKHGTQATKKNFRRKTNGAAVCGVEGVCDQGCGHIQITAGEWRRARNPSRFVRVMPGEEDRTDWRMGNPLTYHDPVSATYGSARFGHNEGFHGQMVTRFGLLKDKAWYRDRREAERDFFQVFCIMHSLAMEQRRRAADASADSGGQLPPFRLVA